MFLLINIEREGQERTIHGDGDAVNMFVGVAQSETRIREKERGRESERG